MGDPFNCKYLCPQGRAGGAIPSPDQCLSKTGRWLGGKTPTGYASRKPVQRDGGRQGEKKPCKLKPIPEEIQLVKTIFEVFMETGSLSKTDPVSFGAPLRTKRGKQFTRFCHPGAFSQTRST